jgi:hypothetical protein
MQNLIIVLMLPSNHHSGGSSVLSTLIMFIIILAIPLSWVIPIIVKTNRKKNRNEKEWNTNAKTQIEQLKDLADLKEKGILTEEEFIAQKNKILGKES